MTSKDRIKILFVGPDYYGSISTCWRNALLELGYTVKTVNSENFGLSPCTLWGKIYFKLRRRPFLHKVKMFNQAVVEETRCFQPDLILFMKGDNVLGSTLQETSRIGANFAYMNDDMFNPNNQSFTFYEILPQLDCIFTTKSYNVSEFLAAGAPLAFFLPNAYDPELHYPAQPSPNERSYFAGDVAFIGTFRPERADFLAQVATFPAEFQFNLWGGGWFKMNRPFYIHKWRKWRRVKACYRGKPLWGPEMGKAMQANKIVLGLFYHANRDLQTTRSFEIPACGGFMLAERSAEHLEYFTEDKEAAYFEEFEEMLDKIRYYLAHEQERRRIAEAGYQRCLSSPYRYVDRARTVLEQFQQMRGLRSLPGKS